MGIYIKDMGMPKNCIQCFLCKICTGKHWELTKYDTGYKWEYIKDNCLLTEVPEPHGRLIDADFEEKHYASMTINPTPDVTPQDYIHSGYAAKAFQMAKTVIEAEE